MRASALNTRTPTVPRHSHGVNSTLARTSRANQTHAHLSGASYENDVLNDAADSGYRLLASRRSRSDKHLVAQSDWALGAPALNTTTVRQLVSFIEQMFPAQRGLHPCMYISKQAVQSAIDNYTDCLDSPSQLTWDAASAMIPHPRKPNGGEDACFITSTALGVADGVGSWAVNGVCSRHYAEHLMQEAADAAMRDEPDFDMPLRIMQHAHQQVHEQGSSTACIVCLDGSFLRCASLGDSALQVVRDGQTVLISEPQQHGFNYPFQLSSLPCSDLPCAAQLHTHRLMPGDVVVVATDGYFDNVFPDESAALATLCAQRGLPAGATAQVLAKYAQQRSTGADDTPFSVHAQEKGFAFVGGKEDDITVVVAYVS